MPFPFRIILLSSALVSPLAFVPSSEAVAQTDEPQPPTLEGGAYGRTPLDQGTSPADVQITQAIRKSLVSTPGMSVDARNVKIVTRSGVVTLDGQVKDEAERDAVVAAAKRIPGVTSVSEHLLTQPAKTTP